MSQRNKSDLSIWLSLFASVGTLLCCALPALLVTLGLGAVVAGLVSNVPGLIWLSEHKVLVFSVAGIILIISGILRIRSARMACPLDPRERDVCLKLRRMNGWIYWTAVLLYGVGFFFAFLAKYFLG